MDGVRPVGSLASQRWNATIAATLEVSAMAPQLKLMALDADDLAVISTHVQDARVQMSDIIWRQGEKRLVVGLNRLDWEQGVPPGTEMPGGTCDADLSRYFDTGPEPGDQSK